MLLSMLLLLTRAATRSAFIFAAFDAIDAAAASSDAAMLPVFRCFRHDMLICC